MAATRRRGLRHPQIGAPDQATGLIVATIPFPAMRESTRGARLAERVGSPESGGPAAASVAQLADVASPLVQCRQDVVGGFRHQADIDARSAEVAEPFQLVEIVGRAADRDR